MSLIIAAITKKNRKQFQKLLGTKDIHSIELWEQSFAIKNLIDKVFVKPGIIDINWRI